MPDNTVEIKFRAKIDEIQSSMQQVSADVKSALDNISASMENVSKTYAGTSRDIANSNQQTGQTFKSAEGTKGASSATVTQWQEELQRLKDLQENWETWSNGRELAFWQEKLARTIEGSDQWNSVWHKIANLQRTLGEEQEAELDKQAKDQEAANEVMLREHVRHAECILDLQRAEIQSRHQLGEIDGRQMLALLRQVDEQQYSEQLEALRGKLELPDLERQTMAEVYAEIEQLQDMHNKKMLKSQTQVALETQKSWQHVLQPIEGSFSSSITGMINKTETFRDALRNVFQSILSEFVSMCVKKIGQWIITQAGLTTATAAGEAGRTGIEEAAAKDSLFVQAMTGLKKIFNAAQETFAGVFAQLSPYLGPLAAVPAGAASALVLATGGALNFAEKGWDVPSDSLAMIHKREMVLPAELADRVRNMTSGAQPGGLPAQGGDTHIHIHAMDSRDVARALNDNQSELFKIFQRGRRNFALT